MDSAAVPTPGAGTEPMRSPEGVAATLGFLAAAVAPQSPAALPVGFAPKFLVAGGCYYTNDADPDRGTSFSWATGARGWVAR